MALLDNLVSYWSLDEAGGGALDAHGSNPLTDNNAVGSTTGKVALCRTFNGTNQSLSHAHNSALAVPDDDFAVSLWVWFDAVAGALPVLYKDSSFAPLAVRYYNVGGADELTFDAYFQSKVLATGVVTSGAWIHVYGQNSKTAGAVGIAVNGGALIEAARGGFAVADDGGDWKIGAGGGGFFPGRVDEVGFWKGRVLTSDERAQLYNGGAGLAYSAFGGGGGSAVPLLMHLNRMRRG